MRFQRYFASLCIGLSLLLGASAPARAQAPLTQANVPNWTAPQWDALLAAAQHTHGRASYVYKAVSYGLDAKAATLASRFGIADKMASTQARNLIDVHPLLRFSLARLYWPSARTEPIPVLNAVGSTTWVVMQLVSRSPSEVPLAVNAEFKTDAAAWVAKSLLPHPEVLLGSNEALARVAYWRARSAQAIEQIPAHLSPDIEFGNSSTPLLEAMLRDDMPSAQALLKRGANVNHCGVWGCPILIAAKMEPETKNLEWTQWLLQNGAKPDQADPKGAILFDTAFTAASWLGYTAVAQQLLDRGASVDGIAGAISTPIEAAAGKGHRAFVEWLIARGASVLPLPDRSKLPIGRGTLFSAALQSSNEAFSQWAEQTMLSAAEKSQKHIFKVNFEQYGKIHPVSNGSVKLKAAPFNLVFEFPADADGIQLGGSTSAKWLEEVRNKDLRNAMFRSIASGAMEAVPKADSYELFVVRPCAPNVKPDGGCEGTHMYFNTDPADRPDFHERRSNPTRFVRTVRKVYDTSGSDNKQEESLSIEKMAGQNLYLVMARPLFVGSLSDQRFPQAQYITVEFSR
jgi:ankyrin repeat protein